MKLKVNNKFYVVLYTVLVILLFIICGLRFLKEFYNNTLLDTSTYVLLSIFIVSLIVIWMISLNRRITNKAFLHQYKFICLWLTIFVALRIIKFRFVDNPDVVRYMWFLYYVPMLLIPLNAFFASLYLGKEEGYHINRAWYYMYIPCGLLMFFVLTNDFHGLVFNLYNGLQDTTHYTHRWGYYLCATWIGLLAIIVLVITFVRCANSNLRKKIWVPIILLIGFSLGFTVYFNNGIFGYNPPLPLADYFTLFIIIFLESFIQINLVRTNVGYIDFYKNSQIFSIITDKEFNVVYKTAATSILSIENMEKALISPIIVDNKWRVTSIVIDNGYYFWAEDVSDVLELKEKLLDVGVSLDEENEIIKAEAQLNERRIKVEKQTEIYTRINELIKTDIIYAKNIIESIKIDDPSYEIKAKEAMISIAYIKRRINLFLITYNEDNLPAKELNYSINELLDYIKLYGVDASFVFNNNTKGGYEIIYLYEQIYTVLLYYLNVAESIFIKVYEKNGDNYVQILIDHEEERKYFTSAHSYERDGITSIITIKGGKF